MKSTTLYQIIFETENWHGKLGNGQVFMTNPSRDAVIDRAIGMANFSLPSHVVVYDEQQRVADEYFFGELEK
ncbi:MAG: hypothetical protein DI539_14325 [Flavobacterium psychrophilum]|nr:MAG: hypothetical protein DI539_14325 [Flavobacterium psychrophilum]